MLTHTLELLEHLMLNIFNIQCSTSNVQHMSQHLFNIQCSRSSARTLDVEQMLTHTLELLEHLMLNIFDVDSYTGALRMFDVAHSMLAHTPELRANI